MLRHFLRLASLLGLILLVAPLVEARAYCAWTGNSCFNLYVIVDGWAIHYMDCDGSGLVEQAQGSFGGCPGLFWEVADGTP